MHKQVVREGIPDTDVLIKMEQQVGARQTANVLAGTKSLPPFVSLWSGGGARQTGRHPIAGQDSVPICLAST